MKLVVRGKDLCPVLTGLTLEKSRGEAAWTLCAALVQAVADTYLPDLTLALGDAVSLLDDHGETVFLGAVQDISRTPEEVRFTAFDRGIYLTRNELYGVFSGSGEVICRQVAAKLGIRCGSIDAHPLSQTIVTRSGDTAYAILRRAAGEEREISVEGDLLTVRKAAGEPKSLGAERFLAVESRGDVTGMVNRAVVLTSKGSPAGTAQNAADLGIYGQFQQVQTVSGRLSEAKAQANAMLKTVERTGEATVLGDLSLRCGGLVSLALPAWGLQGIYRITAVRHRWKRGLFITELSLEAEG